MEKNKPDNGSEPSLEAIHTTTINFHRAMGKRIVAFRRSREMTQTELARILGISQQSVFSLELGDRRVRIDLIPALARTFGVTADELLALKPMPPLKESPLPERLLRHLEVLRQLSEGDQRFILKLAETMTLR